MKTLCGRKFQITRWNSYIAIALALDRNIKFSGIVFKLSSLHNAKICFKYQLLEEDRDTLISTTNEEDIKHMITMEYSHLYRTTAKPTLLWLLQASL